MFACFAVRRSLGTDPPPLPVGRFVPVTFSVGRLWLASPVVLGDVREAHPKGQRSAALEAFVLCFRARPSRADVRKHARAVAIVYKVPCTIGAPVFCNLLASTSSSYFGNRKPARVEITAKTGSRLMYVMGVAR